MLTHQPYHTPHHTPHHTTPHTTPHTHTHSTPHPPTLPHATLSHSHNVRMAQLSSLCFQHICKFLDVADVLSLCSTSSFYKTLMSCTQIWMNELSIFGLGEVDSANVISSLYGVGIPVIYVIFYFIFLFQFSIPPIILSYFISPIFFLTKRL
jgi:hypothetical protein